MIYVSIIDLLKYLLGIVYVGFVLLGGNGIKMHIILLVIVLMLIQIFSIWFRIFSVFSLVVGLDLIMLVLSGFVNWVLLNGDVLELKNLWCWRCRCCVRFSGYFKELELYMKLFGSLMISELNYVCESVYCCICFWGINEKIRKISVIRYWNSTLL